MTGLTKSFFNCKSSSRAIANYEFAPYQKQETSTLQEDDTLMEFSNLPSSTMIESKDNFESTTLSYHLMPSSASTSATTMQSLEQMSTIERQNRILKPAPSFISIPSFDNTQTLYDSEFLIDTENTRHRRASLLSVSTFKSDSNCETVHHNRSPLSEYKSNYQLDESSTILYECLHSTKISSSTKNITQACEQCPQCNITKIQETTTLSPFSTKSKLSLDSPLLSSSTASTSPISSRHIDSQDSSMSSNTSSIQPYQSMISYLSSTVNDENSNATHICTSNYEATFVDDVTVKFADMVKILRSNSNDEWVQVQVASDGRKGFVPKNIILDIKQFINQLKQATNNTTVSTINNL